jgi:hypothetical protein
LVITSKARPRQLEPLPQHFHYANLLKISLREQMQLKFWCLSIIENMQARFAVRGKSLQCVAAARRLIAVKTVQRPSNFG